MDQTNAQRWDFAEAYGDSRIPRRSTAAADLAPGTAPPRMSTTSARTATA